MTINLEEELKKAGELLHSMKNIDEGLTYSKEYEDDILLPM